MDNLIIAVDSGFVKMAWLTESATLLRKIHSVLRVIYAESWRFLI
jgi:hypothetical protein